MFDSVCFDIYKHQVFIKNKQLSLTYGEAFEIASSWAQYFNKTVVGNTIALATPNCLESHLLLLAAIKNHNVVVINPSLLRVSPDLAKRLGATNLVAFEQIPGVGINTTVVRQADVLDFPTHSDNSPFTQRRLTLLSSGTTGEVKPIVLEPTEIKAYGSILNRYFTFNTSDCLYNVLPYYHGFGLTRMFTVMNSGSSYYVPDDPDYRNIVTDINQQGCTWISLVPNMAKIMIKNTGQLPFNFRLATVSADICDSKLINAYRDRFGLDLLSEYGCTEASIISSNTFDKQRDGSVGQVNPSLVKLVNDEVHALAGWRNTPQWVNTGDIGELDSDGFLYIKGRTKEIIKRQGKTIFPKELEQHLEDIAGVEEAVAYADDVDNKGDRIGVAYVGTINEQELKAYCAANLPFEYRPHRVTKIDQIPRVGPKIRRKEVRQYVNEFQ